MHKPGYTPWESADLYHFTLCLITHAHFSAVLYSVLDINSERHVQIHLSGCLILSPGSSRVCLKAWRRRKINSSTSMTNIIPFSLKCRAFILRKRKYLMPFQAQHFKSKDHLNQGLLFSKQADVFFSSVWEYAVVDRLLTSTPWDMILFFFTTDVMKRL